jgi:hypothetical protein
VKFTWDYILVNLLFIVLGGCLAVAYNEDRAWTCIGIGVGLPAAVSALAYFHRR